MGLEAFTELPSLPIVAFCQTLLPDSRAFTCDLDLTVLLAQSSTLSGLCQIVGTRLAVRRKQEL